MNPCPHCGASADDPPNKMNGCIQCKLSHFTDRRLDILEDMVKKDETLGIETFVMDTLRDIRNERERRKK